MLVFLLATWTGCQDYGVNGRGTDGAESAATSSEVAVSRTVLHVVVRGAYAGKWTDGVIDRSSSCFAETESGTDYSGCCPNDFSAVGFWNEDDGIGAQPYSVVCLEDPPGTDRTVVYVSGGGTWDASWVGGGTWNRSVYREEACAVEVRADALDPEDADAGYEDNPPDDFNRCCPEGFSPIGQGKRGEYLDIVCLESR